MTWGLVWSCSPRALRGVKMGFLVPQEFAIVRTVLRRRSSVNVANVGRDLWSLVFPSVRWVSRRRTPDVATVGEIREEGGSRISTNHRTSSRQANHLSRSLERNKKKDSVPNHWDRGANILSTKLVEPMRRATTRWTPTFVTARVLPHHFLTFTLHLDHDRRASATKGPG